MASFPASNKFISWSLALNVNLVHFTRISQSHSIQELGINEFSLTRKKLWSHKHKWNEHMRLFFNLFFDVTAFKESVIMNLISFLFPNILLNILRYYMLVVSEFPIPTHTLFNFHSLLIRWPNKISGVHRICFLRLTSYRYININEKLKFIHNFSLLTWI